MSRKRLAVVLFNLGGPDGPKAVRPFLFNLFNDPAIITLPAPARLALAVLISTTRAKMARGNYARMGGASPLLPETKAQAAALQAALEAAHPDQDVRVFIAMRYWKPDSRQTAAEVKAFAPDDVVLLPLYPQFSSTTTASSLAAWRKAYDGPGAERASCCYPVGEELVEAHAQRIEEAWRKAGRPERLRLLFSAHGLPQKIVDGGDPYEVQVQATAAAVAARLAKSPDWPNLDWKVCYQSKIGRLKWLGPSTTDLIAESAAEGLGVIITPIAFVSEHVETLVELDHDYAEFAKGVGCPAYVRVAALGVTPAFIEALARMVKNALDRSHGTEPASAWRCGSGWNCPANAKALGETAA
jgi:ferrochelatase